MTRFTECLTIIDSPEVEGGYSDHPNDYGGPTDRGITQETYDKYRESIGEPLRPVKGIGNSEVEAIYMCFWNAAKCDVMPEPLDLLIFDVAINSGPNKSIVLLQRALDMPKQYQTGNFGPITRGALSDAISADGVMPLCDKYLIERLKFYNNRIILDPSQAVFIKGWRNRVQYIAKVIGLDGGFA